MKPTTKQINEAITTIQALCDNQTSCADCPLLRAGCHDTPDTWTTIPVLNEEE